MELSKCCDSRPWLGAEVLDGFAICNKCKEWSDFWDDDDPITGKEEENDTTIH